MKISKNDAEIMEHQLWEELGSIYLEIRKLTRTRRYYVPGGHCDPAWLSLNIEYMIRNCVTMYGGDVLRLEVVDRYAFFVAACLVQHKMPVYFVDQGILDAILRTEPPENMLFEDLHWPMPVAAFIPPEGGIKTPSGEYVTNLSYTFQPAEQLVRIPGMPAMDVSAAAVGKSHCIGVLANTSKGETYAQYVPLNLDTGVGDFMAYVDNIPFAYTGTVQDENKLGNVDVEFNRFMLSMVLRLVMVMAARPNLVSYGDLKGPAKTPILGLPRAEVWTPNWVGYGYKAARERVNGHGHGASKSIHWRVGHWRNQAHGPKQSLRKLLWIEPVLIGE